MADAIAHLSSGRTRIEWLSQLKTEYRPAKAYRRTAIIGTIGAIRLLYSHRTESSGPGQLTKLFHDRSKNEFGGEDQFVEKRYDGLFALYDDVVELNILAGLNVVRMNFSHGSYEVQAVETWGHGHIWLINFTVPSVGCE